MLRKSLIRNPTSILGLPLPQLMIELYGQIGLAPFHDLDGQVPQVVKDKLAEIKTGLED